MVYPAVDKISPLPMPVLVMARQADCMHWRRILATAVLASGSLGVIALSPPTPVNAADNWWNTTWGFRVPIQVGAAGTDRSERPAEADIDFAAALNAAGSPGSFDPATIRVLEVDAGGVAQGVPLPAEFDANGGASGHLTWMMPGNTAGGATRRFYVYFDHGGTGIQAQNVNPLVSLTATGVTDSGLDAYRIATQSGTWYYDKVGAAFSSVVDAAGRDWVGYTSDAPAKYTGIPNLTDDWFHPGGLQASSQIVSSGPLRVVIDGQSNDGQWAIRTELFPRYTRSTVTRKGANGYWFQYEGIPGGGLNHDSAFSLRSQGGGPVSAPLGEHWENALNGEEWMGWGIPAQGRSFFLAHHSDDDSGESHTLMDLQFA